MIPFKNRFHGHNSLSYVYKNGHVVRGHLATVKYVRNSHSKDSRVAVVIGKKILKSAVRRNLIRRRIYEYIRPKLSSLNDTYDMVIIITSGDIIGMDHGELCEQLDSLMKRAKIKKLDPYVQKSHKLV